MHGLRAWGRGGGRGTIPDVPSESAPRWGQNLKPCFVHISQVAKEIFLLISRGRTDQQHVLNCAQTFSSNDYDCFESGYASFIEDTSNVQDTISEKAIESLRVRYYAYPQIAPPSPESVN